MLKEKVTNAVEAILGPLLYIAVIGVVALCVVLYSYTLIILCPVIITFVLIVALFTGKSDENS
jgi:hypothetical protein